jgi:hypothetical protein
MRRVLILALVAAALSSAGAALAASLGVTSASLTLFTTASSVQASTCVLDAAADTHADAADASTSYGNAAQLLVRASSSPARTFVRFDLDACSLPAGARVTAASLSLYLANAPPGQRTYEVRRATATWAETTLTWDAQPAVAATATAATSAGTSNGATISWSVLTDVQAFVAGSATNHGWRVADDTESSPGIREGQFGSSAASAGQRPVLTITYYA